MAAILELAPLTGLSATGPEPDMRRVGAERELSTLLRPCAGTGWDLSSRGLIDPTDRMTMYSIYD